MIGRILTSQLRQFLEEEQTYLISYRIRVYAFTDPYLALEHFKTGLYDLILVDIVMPKMDGFELYYNIRKVDDKVKICFLTASDIPEVSRKEMFADDDLSLKCLLLMMI